MRGKAGKYFVDRSSQCAQGVVRFGDGDKGTRPVFDSPEGDGHRKMRFDERQERRRPDRVRQRNAHGHMSRQAVCGCPIVLGAPLPEQHIRDRKEDAEAAT